MLCVFEEEKETSVPGAEYAKEREKEMRNSGRPS